MGPAWQREGSKGASRVGLEDGPDAWARRGSEGERAHAGRRARAGRRGVTGCCASGGGRGSLGRVGSGPLRERLLGRALGEAGPRGELGRAGLSFGFGLDWVCFPIYLGFSLFYF